MQELIAVLNEWRAALLAGAGLWALARVAGEIRAQIRETWEDFR